MLNKHKFSVEILKTMLNENMDQLALFLYPRV